MKKLYILILLFLSFSNLIAGWKLMDSAKISMLYWDIDCYDKMNCFAVGNSGDTQSAYTKTTDGGYTWNIIFFDEAKKIYDSNGVWISTIMPKFNPIRCIDYVTQEFAIAGHNDGQITITRDGGKTWDSTNFNTEKNIVGVKFIDSTHGVIFGYSSIYKTIDGGHSWSKLDLSEVIETDNSIVDFDLVGNDSLLILVYDKTNPEHKFYKLMSTEDGGNSWNESSKIPQYTDWKPFFLTIDVGWIAGRIGAGGGKYKDVIYKTINGGENWELQLDTVANIPLGLNGIYFRNKFEGIAWGEGGKIWRTENGGENWIRDESFPFEKSDHFRDLAFPEGHTHKILANVYIFRHIWMYEESTSVKQISKDAAQVYPNPSGDVLNITSEKFNSKKVKIVISNTTGQQFLQQEIYFSGSHSINTNFLPSGAYIMTLFCEGAVINKPFAVVR